MNANRKADLQRKLTLAPVPKPPAGLAERIKTEIPKELRFSAERERERFTRSVRFSMAVAASVIVVISAAYISLLMTRMDQSTVTAPTRQKPIAVAPPAKAPAPTLSPAAPPPQPAKIATRRVKQEKKQPVAPAEPQAEAMGKVAAAAPAAAMDRAEASMFQEMTTSPISGKVMVHAGNDVYDVPSSTNVRLIPWKDTSRETKIAILKTELARGGDREAIARAAREAGLNELADSIERPR